MKVSIFIPQRIANAQKPLRMQPQDGRRFPLKLCLCVLSRKRLVCLTCGPVKKSRADNGLGIPKSAGKPCGFLNDKTGCSGRDRTCDQVINSHLLYR